MSASHAGGGAPNQIRIGVLGGGTAGYLSALAFQRHVPGAYVEVIAARDIPPIGVGESTFPQIVGFLHEYLGLPIDGFYASVQPTWKLGTRFVWGMPGEHAFNFPFAVTDYRAAHSVGSELRRGSIMGVLMDDEKSFILRGPDDAPTLVAGAKHAYAYQLDNRRLISYLRDEVARAGIPLLDAQIVDVDLDQRGGAIHALRAADGRTLSYDLYVDCSGFRSVLLERALGVPFVDFATSLYTNRAIVGSLPNGGRIRPFTVAETMDCGWMWRISMRDEDHLGYVFSGDHCSEDEAVAEFERKTGARAQPHVLRFPTGRHEMAWRNNVVAIGNAFAFVEPLQATGIQMILSAIRRAVNVLRSDQDRAAAVREYNDATNTKWDFLRGFIALHYRFNKRLDTSFWRDCRATVDLADIVPLIDHFHRAGLLSLADAETRAGFHLLREAGIFGTHGIDLLLLGQGERPGATPADMERSRSFERKRRIWDQVSARALSQRAALDAVENRLHILTVDHAHAS